MEVQQRRPAGCLNLRRELAEYTSETQAYPSNPTLIIEQSLPEEEDPEDGDDDEPVPTPVDDDVEGLLLFESALLLVLLVSFCPCWPLVFAFPE